jgi:hypothetical protein
METTNTSGPGAVRSVAPLSRSLSMASAGRTSSIDSTASSSSLSFYSGPLKLLKGGEIWTHFRRETAP